MLTFFTTCKPFEGQTAVLQRNAIQSWLRLGRGCDVAGIRGRNHITQLAQGQIHRFPA